QERGGDQGRGAVVQQKLSNRGRLKGQIASGIPRRQTDESIKEGQAGGGEGALRPWHVAGEDEQDGAGGGQREPCQQVQGESRPADENRMHNRGSRAQLVMVTPPNIALPVTVRRGGLEAGSGWRVSSTNAPNRPVPRTSTAQVGGIW